MRLWHKSLLRYLPRKQLLSQLRECVAIAKEIYTTKTIKHSLIKPILNYPLSHFHTYLNILIDEFKSRNYRISQKTFEKLKTYIDFDYGTDYNIPFNGLFCMWHNSEYLKICYYNLLEKYRCKMMTDDEFDKIFRYFNECSNLTAYQFKETINNEITE